MHCIFIHGTGGNPEEAFFPWCREELERLGLFSSAPELPSSMKPDRNAWIEAVLEVYDPKQETLFVGRSSGGTLIPYLLELDGVRARAAISIAAPYDDLGWENLKDFFSLQPDFEKAKQSVQKYFHWYSDDDPYIPVEHGLKFQELLGGKFRLFKGYSHFFNKEFPELVEVIANEV